MSMAPRLQSRRPSIAKLAREVCALAIRDGLIPPTLNYQTPDPACDLDVVPNEPREKNLKYVLRKAFGFGGINSCVVYKKV